MKDKLLVDKELIQDVLALGDILSLDMRIRLKEALKTNRVVRISIVDSDGAVADIAFET